MELICYFGMPICYFCIPVTSLGTKLESSDLVIAALSHYFRHVEADWQVFTKYHVSVTLVLLKQKVCMLILCFVALRNFEGFRSFTMESPIMATLTRSYSYAGLIFYLFWLSSSFLTV